MSRQKPAVRGYFAQLAEPVPQGEPVFTARRGAAARAQQLPVEAPVVEDVIESREGQWSRSSRVVQRKAHAASGGLAPQPAPVKAANESSTGTVRPAIPQVMPVVTEAREISYKVDQQYPRDAHIAQQEPLTSQSYRAEPKRAAEPLHEEPVDVYAERRRQRLTGGREESKPLVEESVSRSVHHRENATPDEETHIPELSNRHRTTQPAIRQHAIEEQVKFVHTLQPALRAEVRTAAERAGGDVRAANDEASRARQALPREFVPGTDKRRSGVSVRIGTIEVRTATPAAPPPPPPPAAMQANSQPAESHLGPRPAPRDSLSSGLAWSFGLIQG